MKFGASGHLLACVMSYDSTTRRDAVKLLGAGAAVATVATGSAAATGFLEDDVLEFDSLAGNQGPFTGQTGTIRGVPAGGLPWVVDEGKAELEADQVEIEVEGLVLDPDDEAVPEDLRGINPVPGFKGVVSCLTFDDGNRLTETLETDPVEVGEDGDAKIEDEIDLPSPCYAPIVFVTAGHPDFPTVWFAVGGA